MRTIRTIRRLPLAVALALTAAPLAASAQDFMSQQLIPYADETFVVELGGIVNKFDTELRLNGATSGGTNINLEGNGLGDSLSSFQGGGSWRINRRHRLGILYYATDRDGTRTYDKSINIGDQTYPLGATVHVKAKDQFVMLNYQYSFVQTPEVEFSGLVGIYGGQFKFEVDATGTVNNSQRAYAKSVSTTLPLPLIGGAIDWYPARAWKVSGALQGMQAKIGNVDGHAYVAGAGLEYQMFRGMGLGARYTHTDISADVTKDSFNGTFGWNTNAWSLYARFVF